ncbi:MAG: hypothetical protein FWG74_06235 [Planctomycetes bacterium]|nr:hypothetical protein [Planctomycetota bacterium]
MIHFRDVWAGKNGNRPDDYLLKGISCDFLPGRHLGILFDSVSAYNCFFQTLCGITFPDSGKIIRRGSVSWPIGWQGVFNRNLTVWENLNFIAAAQGADPARVRKFVSDFTGLGNMLAKKFGDCPGAAKAKFAFAAPCAIPFDFYLGSNALTAGEKKFHAKCKKLIRFMLKRHTFIVMTDTPGNLKSFSDTLLALHDGRLYQADSLEDLKVVHGKSL